MYNRTHLVIIDSYIDIDRYKNIPRLELWLSDNIKSINFEIFSNLENISIIKIPEKTIINDTIKKCNNVEKILIDNNNKSIKDIDISIMKNIKYY